MHFKAVARGVTRDGFGDMRMDVDLYEKVESDPKPPPDREWRWIGILKIEESSWSVLEGLFTLLDGLDGETRFTLEQYDHKKHPKGRDEVESGP